MKLLRTFSNSPLVAAIVSVQPQGLKGIVKAVRLMFGTLKQRLRWWWSRNELRRLEQQVNQAVAAGDVQGVITVLEYQLHVYDWPFQTEALLFKRKLRPQDPLVALDLLAAMQASSVLRCHQRFYAGIAAAYSALALDQGSRFPALVGWLHQQAQLQADDSVQLADSSRNRENSYKQLISARACLLQFALVDQAHALVDAIAEANLAVLQRLDPDQLPADVLYRSLTNLLRGLLPLSTSKQGCERLLDQLEGLVKELKRRRYRRPRRLAKENHLAMLELVQQSLRGALDGETTEQCQQRLQLMLNTPAERAQQGLKQWLASSPASSSAFSTVISAPVSSEGC